MLLWDRGTEGPKTRNEAVNGHFGTHFCLTRMSFGFEVEYLGIVGSEFRVQS
jgi:hypothetical protein